MAPATLRASAAVLLGALLALPQPALPAAALGAGREEPKTSAVAESQAEIDALKAKVAAESARTAAHRAQQVAAHSVRITEHAQSALKHARRALHSARKGGQNLTAEQRTELKKAEKKLDQATKAGEYGEQESEQERALKAKLQKKLKEHAQKRENELERMYKEVRNLRKKLAGTEHEEQLREIEEMLKELREKKATEGWSHDELKAELERLREAVNRIKASTPSGSVEIRMAPKSKAPERLQHARAGEVRTAHAGGAAARAAARQEGRGSQAPVDIDTEMPYGNIEPFGREDTAQELTEASIRESNAMVDQLERAEVAEEKRAVFRALTRLRGAAITSYDGVARSQTGNLDEYSKVHKWRPAHPLRHLAEEESDISKWAFPDANL